MRLFQFSELLLSVEPVRTPLTLQAGYGLTPAAVDVKIDSFLHSRCVTATR